MIEFLYVEYKRLNFVYGLPFFIMQLVSFVSLEVFNVIFHFVSKEEGHTDRYPDSAEEVLLRRWVVTIVFVLYFGFLMYPVRVLYGQIRSVRQNQGSLPVK